MVVGQSDDDDDDAAAAVDWPTNIDDSIIYTRWPVPMPQPLSDAVRRSGWQVEV